MNTLSPTEEQVLLAFARMHYLTNAQVHRRLCTPGKSGLRQAQRYTQRLVMRGYLHEMVEPKYGRGSRPTLYAPSEKGRDYAERLGAQPKRALYKSELEGREWTPNMWHTMEVNDILIAFELAEKRGAIFGVDFMHERDIQQLKLPIKPDGFIEFLVDEGDGDPDHRGYVLEHDRANERQKVIGEKVEKLCRLIEDEKLYQASFGIPWFNGVLFVASNEKRAHQLQDWISATLGNINRRHFDDAFIVTTLAAATNPEWLTSYL